MQDQGNKHDAGKPRFDLIDPYFHEDVAIVLTDGAQEYGDYNWMKIEKERYIAALERHLNAFKKGEMIDPKSGKPHMAHVACNAMFLHYFGRRLKNANINIQRFTGNDSTSDPRPNDDSGIRLPDNHEKPAGSISDSRPKVNKIFD